MRRSTFHLYNFFLHFVRPIYSPRNHFGSNTELFHKKLIFNTNYGLNKKVYKTRKFEKREKKLRYFLCFFRPIEFYYPEWNTIGSLVEFIVLVQNLNLIIIEDIKIIIKKKKKIKNNWK